MDIKIVKDITKLMSDNDLVEVELESEGLKLRLKKAVASVTTIVPAVAAAPAPVAAPVAAAPAPVVDEFAGCKQIISPIPGTVVSTMSWTRVVPPPASL